MAYIDLSFPIETGMPTCGTSWHQRAEVRPMGELHRVGRNTHSIKVGSHTGTHMDAPYHFLEEGRTIDQLEIEDMCGEISIVDFRDFKEGSVVKLADVQKIKVEEKMLFVFGWYKKWKTDAYYRRFPYFAKEAVSDLIRRGMRFMALDTPSPDDGSAIGRKDDSPNHKNLLSHGVIIVEYLNNTECLCGGKYEIYALPLKVRGSDGSPCRVIVKEVIR